MPQQPRPSSSWDGAPRPVPQALGVSRECRAGIYLYWIPLGAGGNFVRFNGCVYEAIDAHFDRRPARDLYHSVLHVFVPEGRYAIEMTPIPDGRGHERGVVAEGPVGARWASRFRMFRYELRRWRDGVIPDLAEAIDSPRRLSGNLSDARRLLELVPQVPLLVWGRDEAGAGEMWNSNSMIAWLIARTGLDVGAIEPPAGGRAPGWHAGLVVAARIPLQSIPTPAPLPVAGNDYFFASAMYFAGSLSNVSLQPAEQK